MTRARAEEVRWWSCGCRRRRDRRRSDEHEEHDDKPGRIVHGVDIKESKACHAGRDRHEEGTLPLFGRAEMSQRRWIIALQKKIDDHAQRDQYHFHDQNEFAVQSQCAPAMVPQRSSSAMKPTPPRNIEIQTTVLTSGLAAIPTNPTSFPMISIPQFVKAETACQ